MEKERLAIHLGEVEATPQEVGYDPRAIENMDNLLQRLICEEKLECGSYLLARHGKIFACKSMGKLCSYEDRGDLMPNSLRRIASITKIYTAAAILQLVEKGLLYLIQPVMTVIDEFNTSKHSGITIFHLLTHTSGIAPDPGYYQEPYQRGWWEYTNEKNWIKAVLAGPMMAQPGEEWNYCSAGYQILGEIVSRVSGMPCEKYIMENIIKPAGMDRSFFDVPEELVKDVCFVSEGEEKRLRESDDRTGKPPRAAGGIYSTLYDLCKMGQLMLNNGTINGNRILGRKTVEVMTKNHLHNVPSYSWGLHIKAYEMGLGWRVTSRNIFSSNGTFSHEGAGRSALYVDPVEQFIAVYFVPSKIGWVPESILNPQGIMWAGIL